MQRRIPMKATKNSGFGILLDPTGATQHLLPTKLTKKMPLQIANIHNAANNADCESSKNLFTSVLEKRTLRNERSSNLAIGKFWYSSIHEKKQTFCKELRCSTIEYNITTVF